MPEAAPRAIRVFVSSTFRDMAAEREELVKFVFPQLRRLCEERGVTWGEVDLRWGITDEQTAEGKVLPICLAEIERSRPYFIGLLGERYGWVPDEIAPELVEQEPWLAEHREHSVTELEILHGVLNDPEMDKHAFFYLRDAAYLETLPEAQREDYREADEGLARKLAVLKERIRSSGFPVHEDYPDPKALGRLVFEDLSALIERLYPAGSKPDALQREAAEHEAFAASRAGVYIGRQEYFEGLDAHAQGDGPPLVVLGESGSGKSALLANWALERRRTHPNELLLMHFVGASPASIDWAGMLRRLMGELKERLAIEVEIPDTPEELRPAFANLLHRAAAKRRVVLLIDALNQLEDRQGARELLWLPPQIPAGVRLVLSTLSGAPLDEAEKRGWPTLEVEPLQAGERKRLIAAYLAQYTKQLSDERTERLAAAPQTANPLYLRALLEELRLWGQHETLNERIAHYLAAAGPEELYALILERYEADYDRERPSLVREAMALIWAARRGLSETELLDLLGANGQPLPRAFWSPLYLAAEQSLVDRAGLLTFFHDYLRQAVRRRYAPTPDAQAAVHLRLADYFDARRDESRELDELPWQLAEAASWHRLFDLLADLDFARRALEASELEVKARWTQIEANTSLRLVDAYRPVIDKPERAEATALGISKLLLDTGHWPEARALLERYAIRCRLGGDPANLTATLVNLAVIVQDQGELDEAMTLFTEAERLSRAREDLVGVHRSLGNQATILLVRGELDRAMALLEEQERICRAIGDRIGLANSLGNQAVILQRRGRLDAAMALHEEEERICRELDDRAGLHRSLANQATVLQVRGEPGLALARYRDWERDCRDLGDRAGLQLSLGNQATVLVVRGELDAAMALLGEQERICRELGDLNGLHRSLGNQAVILQRQGKFDDAMRLQKEKEQICRRLGDRAGLHLSLGNQGQILKAQGQPDAAMALLREQERICRELGDQEGLQDSLGNQGAILLNQDELDAATALLREQERICRGLGHRAGLAISLGNQALILQRRGELHPALELIDQAEGVLRELGDVLELAKTLLFKGILLSATGHEDQAVGCVQEAQRIALPGSEVLETCERLLSG